VIAGARSRRFAPSFAPITLAGGGVLAGAGVRRVRSAKCEWSPSSIGKAAVIASTCPAAAHRGARLALMTARGRPVRPAFRNKWPMTLGATRRSACALAMPGAD
jgi:hypothetical protein